MHWNRKNIASAIVLSFAAILVPSVAHADMIWPALFIEPRLLSIPVVLIGLLVEAAFLRLGFRMTWGKAVWASTVVNGISAIIGVVAYPVAGIIWELFPGILLYKFFNMGTFSPATWAANFFIALLVTTAIEIVCLRFIFKAPANRRTWFLWLGANAISIALAFASLAIEPPSGEAGSYRPWLFF